MKLAAFCAGRQHGNTEVFMKEALMAAEAKGIEVEFYRLRDFELNHCTACYNMCPPDPNMCPHKDDNLFLVEAFLNCDGYLVGAPVYSLTPNSMLFTFRDRVFGPKMDAAGVRLGMPEMPFVKGRFKARPGGLISVGGAGTEHWTSLGLPGLYSTTFSAQTEIVDHLNVYGVADHDAATIAEDWLAKARKLGENVADALMEKANGQTPAYRGEAGLCPDCHSSFLEKRADGWYCPQCLTKATLTWANGELEVAFTPEEQAKNRWSPAGQEVHDNNIRKGHGKAAAGKDIIAAKRKEYAEYKDAVALPELVKE